MASQTDVVNKRCSPAERLVNNLQEKCCFCSRAGRHASLIMRGMTCCYTAEENILAATIKTKLQRAWTASSKGFGKVEWNAKGPRWTWTVESFASLHVLPMTVALRTWNLFPDLRRGRVECWHFKDRSLSLFFFFWCVWGGQSLRSRQDYSTPFHLTQQRGRPS